MAHKPTDLDNIPHFLMARSPKGLRRLMLANNMKHGLIFNYYQIIFDGSKWYAWFQMNAVEAMEAEIRAAEVSS